MTKRIKSKDDPIARASRGEASFRIREGLYLIGSLERGVTVYGQQVRAHNLVWALWKLQKKPATEVVDLAIVGGGMAGLTAAACALGLFPNAKVTIFERSWDLCALQQGCDSRWLHPRIYGWPEPGSRAPSASLPVLNWQEGRASDVAHEILRRFGKYSESRRKNLSLHVGVDHLSISAKKKEIEWVGKVGIPDGGFFRAGDAEGQSKKFDRIILAMGFGMERQHPDHPTPSYWRNEEYAQPSLDGITRSYIVSGYGDGAIIDLCRLTIERFRQDRILDELFGTEIERTEANLVPVHEGARKGENIFDALVSTESRLLTSALNRLKARIRKDTRVILHLTGRVGNKNTRLRDVFGNTSSFMNRLLLYLLYRSGAFVPCFDSLDKVVREHRGPSESVICRHGGDAMAHVKRAFIDASLIQGALDRFKAAPSQLMRREWEPGCFPNQPE